MKRKRRPKKIAHSYDPPAPLDGASVVYFFQHSVPDGLIKIGFTKSARNRIGTIRCFSPVPIKALSYILADPHLEKELHRRFSHLRVRHEWFNPGQDLLDFMYQNATPWEDAPYLYEKYVYPPGISYPMSDIFPTYKDYIINYIIKFG
jgi:hypothetical protein